jgi:glycosyltransferase involved in cell wall biosynthesis
MCKVSILMPCYNAAATLEEALESMARQSYQNFEIIALEDGSQDGTLKILQAWSQRDLRLRVFSQEHRGILAALNNGLEICTGEYIARMDADDRCHPDRLEQQVNFMNQDPTLAVCSCLVRLFPDSAAQEGFRIYTAWLNDLVTDVEIKRELFVESPIPHPSAMIRREWLERVGGYQEHGWPEDYDLWLRLYLAGARFAKVPQVLLDWRESPGRLTRQDSRYSLENFLRLKAHYLALGPLQGKDAILLWGAGTMGRRLGKQLQHLNASPVAYIDIDPRKIGRTRLGVPVLSPAALPELWNRFSHPVILVAVGARGARALIRTQLIQMGFIEGRDWWGAA